MDSACLYSEPRLAFEVFFIFSLKAFVPGLGGMEAIADEFFAALSARCRGDLCLLVRPWTDLLSSSGPVGFSAYSSEESERALTDGSMLW